MRRATPRAGPAAESRVGQAWRLAMIGAGPVGLAAAARLIERGIDPVVLEAGASVGANLLDFGQVRLSSPWRYDIDPAMAEQLEAGGCSVGAAPAAGGGEACCGSAPGRAEPAVADRAAASAPAAVSAQAERTADCCG